MSGKMEITILNQQNKNSRS